MPLNDDGMLVVCMHYYCSDDNQMHKNISSICSFSELPLCAVTEIWNQKTTAIHTAVLRVAVNFGINLIFYGEDGEVEYGVSE